MQVSQNVRMENMLATVLEFPKGETTRGVDASALSSMHRSQWEATTPGLGAVDSVVASVKAPLSSDDPGPNQARIAL
jgi:hypothetical protein